MKNLRSPIINVVSVALFAWRPVFVALAGAVSFQKLDQQCSVKQKASYRRSVASAMTVLARTYVLLALRLNDNRIELCEEICIGCKLCAIACSYGAISSGAELMPLINYAVEPKYYLEIESQAGAKDTAIKCDMSSGAKTALRASRFIWPARSS